MSDMTSAAAIDLLDNLIGMVDDNQGNDYDSALHMAIEALKAQDADSDTISRKAAIDAILAVTGNSSVRELYEHVQEHGLSDMWSGGVNAAIDIIIAVPSAQPDLIAKIQNGINATNANDSYSCGMRNGMRWCMSLVDDKEPLFENCPSAQPERRWIPCSERMPKKNGFYLCTTKDCITILEFIEGNPHYHEEPSFVSDVLGKCNSYVVAWMPLPEPYAERRSDEADYRKE